MDWSPQQIKALDEVGRWLKTDSQVFYLAGYAGTGKTELAKHLAQGASGEVLFGAYTGKAAYVLRQRGCRSATTIHSLIYNPKDRSKKRLLALQQELTDALLSDDDMLSFKLRGQIREEQENLKRPFFALNPDSPVRGASLVVIDEVSMVDQYVGEDLLSFGTKVLVIGDPFQLPPVRGSGYFTKNDPDIMLTEIHRQAKGNPIIELATKVRMGQTLDYGEYGSSVVMDWADIDAGVAQGADQILVGTNKLRRGTNHRMRDLQGIEHPLPVKGDRLVCLRNDHKVGLLNGAIWYVEESTPVDEDFLNLVISPEDEGDTIDVTAHTAHFLGREIGHWDHKKAQELDYGYALTVHKAQGSQWKKVLLFDQSKSFRAHSQQWLYTGITRASERVTIVR